MSKLLLNFVPATWRPALRQDMRKIINLALHFQSINMQRTLVPGQFSLYSPADHEEPTMFIAMNRFKVMKGREEAFENLWLNRDSRLDDVVGFLEFHMLKGPALAEHTLYASHTVWASKDAFTAWTQSEHFRAAHRHAGKNEPMYFGHPEFEGFDVIQQLKKTDQTESI